MQTQHWQRMKSVLVVGGLLACALAGCELGGSSPDTNGIDNFFNEHPYVSDPRVPGAPRDLSVTPESAIIANVGDVVVFTVKGGEKPYHWGAANGNGTIDNLGEEGDQGLYRATAIGANTVVAFDSNGHAALAEITVGSSVLTITPSSATLTNNGATATFTVTGGLPPYTWTLLNGNGALNVNTGPTVIYTRSVTGNNAVTVKDGSGVTTFTATIQQP